MINVLDKHFKYMNSVPFSKAAFSVKTNKSEWVNPNTIRVLYNNKDLKCFKDEVNLRDNYTCFYCGEVMHADHPELTVDHLTPKRLGGSVLPDNMVCSCRTCNGQKSFRTFEQYFIHLYAAISFVLLLSCKEKAGGGSA